MSPAFVAVEEYRAHSYDPDREYVEGKLVERRGFEYFHSLLVALLCQQLQNQRDKTGIAFRTLPNQRVRVSEHRYRIPDVIVLAPGYRKTSVILDPPDLTIEVLSTDDTLEQLVTKSQEYLSFGVRVPLIADPYKCCLYRVTDAGE